MLALGLFVLWFIMTSGTTGVKLIAGFTVVNYIYTFWVCALGMLAIIAVFFCLFLVVVGDDWSVKLSGFLGMLGSGALLIFLGIGSLVQYYVTSHLIVSINPGIVSVSQLSENNMMLSGFWLVLVLVSIFRMSSISTKGE